jgi:hypothetical protein
MNKLTSNRVRRLAGVAIITSVCFGVGVPIASATVASRAVTSAVAIHPATDCPAGDTWQASTDSCVPD